MLSVHLDTGEYLFGEQVRDLAAFLANHRRVRDGSFDPVLSICRAVGADKERDFCPAPEHLAHNPLVGFASLFSNGL